VELEALKAEFRSAPGRRGRNGEEGGGSGGERNDAPESGNA